MQTIDLTPQRYHNKMLAIWNEPGNEPSIQWYFWKAISPVKRTRWLPYVLFKIQISLAVGPTSRAFRSTEIYSFKVKKFDFFSARNSAISAQNLVDPNIFHQFHLSFKWYLKGPKEFKPRQARMMIWTWFLDFFQLELFEMSHSLEWKDLKEQLIRHGWHSNWNTKLHN